MERTMKTPFWLFLLAGLAVAALLPAPLRAGSKEAATVEEAIEVLDALTAIPLKAIPPALFKDAQGVAIFPGVIKAGFVIGGRYGRGVILVRERADSWGKPVFLTITGGSIGWQIGVQSTDLVLIFKTRSSVNRILKGKGKVTLGADVAVAAGPVGRQAEADTDARLQAEIYSYSRSRGLFAGLSLEGAALLMDPEATAAFYRTPPAGLVDGVTGRMIPLTPPEDTLRLKLAILSTTWAPPAVISPAPSAPPPPSSRPPQQNKGPGQ
jgi:lipid-binding SYLF domain-containing protein